MQELWAKTDPFQSVCVHGLMVGMIAQEIYGGILAEGNREILMRSLSLNENKLLGFIGYWSSLHDIGKIDYLFQCKESEMRARLDAEGLQDGILIGNSVRHEQTSVSALIRIWKAPGIRRKPRNLFSKLIGAHHQGKTGSGHKIQSEPWCAFQEEFEEMMRQSFLNGELLVPDYMEEQEGTISALLLGILILADWIASGDAFEDAGEVLAKSNGMVCLRERVKRFFDNNGFLPSDVTWGDGFCDIWPNIPEKGRRPLQAEMENLFRNSNQRFRMVLVEAPMGEGKTEAGLNGLFDNVRNEVKLLYRVQSNGRDCAVYLYSESPVIPGKLLPFMTLAGERDVTAWQSTMTEGRRVRFDLLTMPSKKVAQGNGKNSRRRVLRTEEERMAWLARKAAQNGFEILSVQELEGGHFAGTHEAERGNRMNWDTYHYRGVLEIRENVAFQRALSGGIGPGKAYGLGMILLI